MGFMAALKGANNSWATVTCEEGVGYLGPEKMVDNRQPYADDQRHEHCHR